MLGKEWEAVKNILVVRLDNIGDVVMLSPVLRALRYNLPEAQITLMASPAGSQAATLLPWVDHIFTWRAIWQDVSGELGLDPDREQALVAKLRKRQFDAALIFTSFTQSPYPPAYACYLAGIPQRIGHSKEFGGYTLTQWTQPPGDEGHQVDRNLSLLEKAGFEIYGRQIELAIPEQDQASAEQKLEQMGIDPSSSFVALVPGASCAARRYSPERFAQAAVELRAQTGLPVVVLGSQREAGRMGPILDLDPSQGIFSLVGQTNVPEFAAVLRRSSLVIANNSAALHLADAFERPMVILYSGTEYLTQWRPRSAPHRLLRQEVECSPCFRFDCPYNMECLDISPRQVVQAALDLLGLVAGKPHLYHPASVEVAAQRRSE